MRAVAAGALDEFERFVRAADPGVRAVVYRIVGDEVDDVLQSAYVKAFRAWGAFEGRSAPSTWLHTIAVNTALDHLRATERSERRDRRALTTVPVGVDPAAQVAASVDLARALSQLRVDRRVVLLLVDGQGLSHSEAAEVLGVPVGTVGSRLSRGRQDLRRHLKGRRDDR